MIFPDNPEAMTHFVRCTEVTSNAPPGSRATQPTGRAWPRYLADPRPGHVATCPVSMRRPEMPAKLSLAFRVLLSRLWESNPRPIHYE